MEFISKLLACFVSKPIPSSPAPLYADAEFLEVVAELARKRARSTTNVAPQNLDANLPDGQARPAA